MSFAHQLDEASSRLRREDAIDPWPQMGQDRRDAPGGAAEPAGQDHEEHGRPPSMFDVVGARLHASARSNSPQRHERQPEDRRSSAGSIRPAHHAGEETEPVAAEPGEVEALLDEQPERVGPAHRSIRVSSPSRYAGATMNAGRHVVPTAPGRRSPGAMRCSSNLNASSAQEAAP